MKKALSLLLALVLCLSLCACGGNGNTLSEKEQALVGEWVAPGDHAGFTLLSSGNVIKDRDSLDFAANAGTSAYCGRWEIEGDFLIIYYEELFYGGSIDSARVYRIISDNQVESGDITYTKR